MPSETDLFSSQVPALLSMLEALIDMPLPDDAAAELAEDYIASYCEQLQFIAELAGEIGIEGFACACSFWLDRLTEQLSPKNITPQQKALINSWAPIAKDFFNQPNDENSEWLVIFFMEADWQISFSEDDQQLLRTLLIQDVVSLTTTASNTASNTTSKTADSKNSSDKITQAEVEKTLLPELPEPIKELFEMFQQEFVLVQESIDAISAAAHNKNNDFTELTSALEISADMITRFGEGAESVGFQGLAIVCSYLSNNFYFFQQNPEAFSETQLVTINNTLSQLNRYLEQPNCSIRAQALLEKLSDAPWYSPLPFAEIEYLVTQLIDLEQSESLEELIDDSPQRPTLATEDMVSLQLPADVNEELLDALLQELPEQTETFSNAVQRMISGDDIENINVAQRIAHTLKGAGNTVGIQGIASLTHHLEDILVALYQEQQRPTPSLSSLLMDAADELSAMGEALTGLAPAPDNTLTLLQKVLDWAHHIDHCGIPGDESSTPELLKQNASVQTFQSPIQPPEQSAQSLEAKTDQSEANNIATERANASPSPKVQDVASHSSTSQPTLRVPESLINELLRMVGESMTISRQVQRMVRQLTQENGNQQGLVSQVKRLSSELETLIDIKDLTKGHNANNDLDTLEMDQYSELHTTSRMIIESMTDSNSVVDIFSQQLKGLNELVVQLERQNSDLQEAVMSSRLVPIKTIVSRLERSIRQTMRLTGKNVGLNVIGEDTLIDGNLLGDLVDPLMHILRNAVDHGIEPESQRQSQGKLPKGNITLSFERQGKHIQVCCQDDGAGINYSAVRARAEQQGLLAANEPADDIQLQQFLLSPNFSTRDRVTDTSGRGIGLDMVYSRVQELGGDMQLQSESGKGCRITLSLPASLMAIHALDVKVGDQTLAISDHGIEQILHMEDGRMDSIGGKSIFHVGDESYAFREIEKLLALPSGRDKQNTLDKQNTFVKQNTTEAVLLVKSSGQLQAVKVPALLDSNDIVVKEMGHYLPPMRGISGVTIGADGLVVPVIDLPEMLRQKRLSSLSNSDNDSFSLESQAMQRSALVVDDSLSARRALVQLLQDIGWSVIEARDGAEAAELAQNHPPSIVITDLEMPRMNGLELVTRLRARSATVSTPIIMITSRASNKHRDLAEKAGINCYLTKPFQEDELLEQVEALMAESLLKIEPQLQMGGAAQA